MAIRIKTLAQQHGIQKAGAIVAEVLSTLEDKIKPGITTKAVELIAKNIILARGAKSATLGYGGPVNPYPGFVCVSVNDEVVHGIGGDRFIIEGDLVSVDVVVEKEGYFADASRTYAVGEISPRHQELIMGTKKALSMGIDAARAGNRVRDISEAIYRVAREHNLGVVRDLVGHGVGLSMHEEPQIPNYISRGPSPRLKPGMVLAIEPMFTTGGWRVHTTDDGWTVRTNDGSFSAHFENTVLVTEDAPQILTY